MATIDRDQLLQSARDFADRALTAYLEEDRRVILANAAFSLEQFCKAYLCSLHPMLLMEIRNGQLDSLLHLGGLGSRARKTRFPRTISAREALGRVEYVLPDVNVARPPLAELIDVRDGVVHVGFLADGDVGQLLTTFLRFANELCDQLGVDRTTRWGRHADLVDSLISQALTEIGQEARRRIAAAKYRYGRFIADVPQEQRAAVITARAALIQKQLTVVPPEGHQPCPACANVTAIFLGDYWLLDTTSNADDPRPIRRSEFDWGEPPDSFWEEADQSEDHQVEEPDDSWLEHDPWDDQEQAEVLLPSWFLAEDLRCTVCGLHLDAEQLEVLGIDRTYELPPLAL